MAENFVLQAREQVGYTALLPSTTARALVGSCFKMIMNVNVPVATGTTQTIAVPEITASLANAAFEVYLSSGSVEDFSTINQVETQTGNIIITRLYNAPTAQITIMLVFYESGG